MLALDQLCKQVAMDGLRGHPPVEALGGLVRLGFRGNSGFAFGLLEEAPASLKDIFFIGIPVFALVLIVLIFIKIRDNQWIMSVGLSLVLAGAVGNLLDRLQYGFVVDFVQVGPVPPFNIADIAIIAGVGLMFYNTLKTRQLQES